MKRDVDLIRSILLAVETDAEMDGSVYKRYDPSDFPNYTQEEINYHVDLILEANLAIGSHTIAEPPSLSRLTWEGHEFTGSASDPDVWARGKERTKSFPDIALSVVWEIAKAEMKRKLGL